MTFRAVMMMLAFVASAGLHAAEAGRNVSVTLPDGNKVELSGTVLSAVEKSSVAATAHGKTSTYEGYDLVALLKAVGVEPVESLRGKALAVRITISAVDGYRVIFALAELDPTIGNRKVFLVDRQDGRPLDEADGAWRLVVPDDHRPARWVRQVSSIAVSKPE